VITQPADCTPNALFAYHHAYPQTIFLVPTSTSRAIAKSVLVPILRQYPGRHLAVVREAEWYSGVETARAPIEPRLLERFAHGKRIVLHDYVHSRADVEVLENLATPDRIIIAAFAREQPDVQLQWSTLCGDHRTFVLTGLEDVDEEPKPQFYSAADVARILGCTKRAVHLLIRRGNLPGQQIGGKFYISIEDFHRKVPSAKRL
jgi:hypothetical protein